MNKAIHHHASEPLRQPLDHESDVSGGVGTAGMTTIDEGDGAVVADDQIAQGRIAMNDSHLFVRWRRASTPTQTAFVSAFPAKLRRIRLKKMVAIKSLLVRAAISYSARPNVKIRAV